MIEVWPGIYTEPGTVHMKSYVHIKGSGRDVTTVKTALGTGATVISAVSKTNVAISELTVTGGGEGISLRSVTSALVIGNNVLGNYWDGISISTGSATITGNNISGNGHIRSDDCSNGNAGVYLDLNDALNTAVINGNVISGNNGCGMVLFDRSSPTISDNIISNNAKEGVNFAYVTAAGTFKNNKVVNNGGVTYSDINLGIESSGTIVSPNISSNVFDDISGSTRGVGSYNVNSNGDPILVP